jgi:putative AbiEi antitoxin of type IV toxin-antitoxin system/uncharacterized protein DUF559
MNSSRERRVPPDRRLASLASRQHGIVTAAQLRKLGLTTNSISYRLQVGRLHRVHRGVYALGHRELSHEGRFLAAVLAVGEGAVLSHIPAAIVLGFWPRGREGGTRVDVSVPRRLKPRPGIRLHLVSAPPLQDTTCRGPIPLTTPARTLLDLAAFLHSDRALRRAIRESQVQGRVSHTELSTQAARAPNRRAGVRLAKLISGGPAGTRSELEDLTLDLLERYGFPRPLTNALVADVPIPIEVDFLFPGRRVVVETDGKRYHDNPLAWETDARKQAILEAAGYRVVRLTWAQVTRDEKQTALRLRRALAGLAGE